MENYIIPEEFPEGPYGSKRETGMQWKIKAPLGVKDSGHTVHLIMNSSPLHQNLPRQIDGAHPPHDDPNKDEQRPYSDYRIILK